MSILQDWKQWARALKLRTYAIYLAYQDPRTPWYARIFAACKMIPPQVYAESQAKAQLLMDQARPKNYVAAALIIAVWLALAALGIYLMFRLIQR